MAVLLAIILALLALLAQKRFLSAAAATVVGASYSATPSGSPSSGATSSGTSTSPGSTSSSTTFPHLIHTIGHSFMSNGAMADAVAKLMGPSWAHTTSGVGGETALGVAARAGAVPWVMHIDGREIPASGRVLVTLDQGGQGIDKNQSWPLLGNGAGENTWGTGQNNEGIMGILGTLAGVDGRLLIDRPAGTVQLSPHQQGDRYYFERTSPGDVVRAAQATFHPTYVASQLGGIVLIEAARNSLPSTDIDSVIQTISKIIAVVPSDRWLVISEWSEYAVTTPQGRKVADYNKAAAEKWGDHFVDTYTFAREKGMDYLHLPLTAQDRQDVADGKIPESLQLDDHLHPNQRGYDVIARAVVNQIEALGIAAPDA